MGAIVQHFYAGVLGGEALAEVLFGQIAPSGRLPIMVPISEKQLPAAYLDQSMSAPPGRTHRYFTGVPLYPFGFGLGYSTFHYGALQVSHARLDRGSAALDVTLTFSVMVRNNGEYSFRASDEVIMVFSRPQLSPSTGNSTPYQLLLGFTRITIEPGSSASAKIDIPAKRFRMLGADGKYELLPGRYELFIGGRAPNKALGLPAHVSAQTEPLHRVLLID